MNGKTNKIKDFLVNFKVKKKGIERGFVPLPYIIVSWGYEGPNSFPEYIKNYFNDSRAVFLCQVTNTKIKIG